MVERRKSGRRAAIKAFADIDVEYSPEEMEFMTAMDLYKREKRRPFPTWSEVFQVFMSLGYRKTEETAN